MVFGRLAHFIQGGVWMCWVLGADRRANSLLTKSVGSDSL